MKNTNTSKKPLLSLYKLIKLVPLVEIWNQEIDFIRIFDNKLGLIYDFIENENTACCPNFNELNAYKFKEFKKKLKEKVKSNPNNFKKFEKHVKLFLKIPKCYTQYSDFFNKTFNFDEIEQVWNEIYSKEESVQSVLEKESFLFKYCFLLFTEDLKNEDLSSSANTLFKIRLDEICFKHMDVNSLKFICWIDYLGKKNK